MSKIQLNVTLSEELVRELRVEAIRLGMRVSSYVELLLRRRRDLLQDAAE